MKNKRVLVAMSGGVDSAVAAAILKDEGYEVIGATMKIWPKEHCDRGKKKACCSSKDTEDAKRVCDTLNIRHYVLNFEEVFRKEVVDYFVNGYLQGRTPNPCIVCNERIKFGILLKKAEAMGCDFISTGHYARIERNGSYRLRESVDKSKDQSYVLFSLNLNQMQKVLFPIGGFTKDNVKAMAKRQNLRIYKKPESQDVCFVLDNNYSNFINEYCNIADRKGDIIDSSGDILGAHNGFWNFTIGQRRGLGISHKTPLYVIKIDAEKNIVVVGDFREVRKKRFTIRDVSWIYRKEGGCLEAEVKIRYNHKKARAVLKEIERGAVEAEFREPQDAITPGQAAVFYDGEYVLGGGWIEKVNE